MPHCRRVPREASDDEGEPPLELVVVVAVEQVVLTVVLVVQHRIGGGQSRLEHRSLCPARATRPIRIPAPAEIRLGEIDFIVPDPLVDHGLQSGPVRAGLRPEDPIPSAPVGFLRRNALSLERPPVLGDARSERIDRGRLIERSDGARGRIEQIDQPGKRVAEKPRDAQRDIDARAVEH